MGESADARVVMVWKRVAWAGCLSPLLGGCFGPFHATDLPPGELVAHTQAAIEHEILKDAREAWREVRKQYSRRDFSSEFRDGFLDGYTDYLDRGGDAQPPAAPPLRYTRHQKYFTPEGHALIRDYYLGFQYGVEVAVATGQRQYLTVPILIPDAEAEPPVIPDVPVTPLGVGVPLQEGVPLAPTAPTVPPLVVPDGAAKPTEVKPIPLPEPKPLPKPKLPSTEARIPGYHQTAWKEPSRKKVEGSLGKTQVTPERVPAKIGSKFGQPPALAGTEAIVPSVVPTIPEPVELPEPPREVPSLPESVPAPPVLDDLPVLPPNHTSPPPLPPNHPEPMWK